MPAARLTLAVADEDRAAVQGLSMPDGVALTSPQTLTAAIIQREREPSGAPIAHIVSPDLLGGVIASAIGRAAFDAAEDDLHFLAEGQGWAIYDLDRDGAEGFGAWLTGRLVAIAEAAAHDATRSRRSLASLRLRHEEALARLQALQIEASFAPPDRVRRFHAPAGEARLGLGGRRRPRSVSQRIPTSPRGVGALDLIVIDAPHDGTLDAALHVPGREAPAARWRFPASTLSPGPLSLRLDHALGRGGAELTLELVWEGDDPLVLGLGPATPLDDYAVAVDKGSAPGAPLALTVWTYQPGLPVLPIDRDAISERSPPEPPPTRFSLAADQMATVERRLPEQDADGYALVRYRAPERDVLVHPIPNGEVTVALIRGVSVGRPRALSALVTVDNPHSRPVEFGLALVPPGAGDADPVRWVERWTVVDALVYAEVVGTLAPGVGGVADLVLATRMAEAGSNSLAWAYVKRVDVSG